MNRIAVLITCHNRREQTLTSLSALFICDMPKEFKIEVFLVDDGSTDGTGDAVRSKFPNVNVIQGNGNLFWNQGMRLAWYSAVQQNNYDFYLWLNDDTILEINALENILDDFKQAIKIENKAVLLIGACKESVESEEFSYGGRDEDGPVIPNDEIQKCKYINGNIVLVPKSMFEDLGNLSKDYTHGMGDYDYGLRAQEKGYSCYTTKHYIAVCPTNKRTPTWCNPERNLSERWKHFNSPLGLNIDEYIFFRKKFWGQQWVLDVVKAYIKMLFPALYNKITVKNY
ncbi:MAG: glycosyltransferase family 2 protein [Balneola sp.]|nr:glycosyltransferase family 2 protein [Balneola sp.]